MKLTFPKSHKTDDMRPLYEEYKISHPEVFMTWLSIERKGKEIGPDELSSVAEHVRNFLKEETEWDGHLSLDYGFLDLRKLLVKEYFGYSLVPGED